MENGKGKTAARISEENGVGISTLAKRWARNFPSMAFDRFRELSEEQAEALLGKRHGKLNGRARKIPKMSVEIPRQSAEISEPETANKKRAQDWFTALCAFDYRVFLVRACLWAVVACQIALLVYGAEKRFGEVGIWVGAFCGVFLFGANLIAGDNRFTGTTDTAFWVVFLLSFPFGTLDFYTFRDYLNLPGSEESRIWFSVMSAFVIHVLALAALSLQGKISNEA